MKLGARIFKTGIAVALSIYLAEFLDMDPVIFAALAAVLTVQPSLYRSWQYIIEQLQANFIGAIFAITFTYFLGTDPFVVGLVVIIVIAINLQFKLERSIPLSIITVIAIMEGTTGNFFWFAINRFLLIMVGIVSSIIVNAIFLPPRYEDKLYTKIQRTTNHIVEYLRSSPMNEVEDKRFREDVKQFDHEIAQIDQLYTFYKEERTYFRRITYSKQKKLVIFRHKIQSMKSALHLLKQLENQQMDLKLIPDELRQLLQREIEILTNYHEKTFLKYEGRVKIHHPHLQSSEVFEGRESLIKTYVALYCDNQECFNGYWIHLFPLFSKVIDYSEHLEKLEKLIENYFTSYPVEE